ncbi:MAG TPA: glucuronate isomerase [Candidatus Dormibacteraeota bacterium]|nr:glucuronate isomerase [Candidatus Dormibacteraeota bacterium]
MIFINDDFLLYSKTARRLYENYAASQPILDYHSHLPPGDVARDRRFRDLFDIALEGDHYKWRAMRANGIAERYCTGDASPKEKFLAWARTVPYTLRNPLYQWTHLELKRYFEIDELLDERSAEAIWERANSILSNGDLTARGILKKFKVRVLCTSDDPCDSLQHHHKVNNGDCKFRMYPTFRPDRALRVSEPDSFNPWVESLQATSNTAISDLASFLHALELRHKYFHESGCRLSDHGLPYCYANPCSDANAAAIFTKVRSGVPASPEEHEEFASFMMLFFGHLDAAKNWTKQLHLGALRNVNTRRQSGLGPDIGFDSIGDWPQAEKLNAYLNLLDSEKALPRTIVYNNNPADNYTFATAVGSFQDSSIAGKIQFGSAWWFLDQKDGIKSQLNALSATGLFPRFVGMVTDSRSFMSFPRHEYFRRVLCNLLGGEMERGELPSDEKFIGSTIQNICFNNARDSLGLNSEPNDGQRQRLSSSS